MVVYSSYFLNIAVSTDASVKYDADELQRDQLTLNIDGACSTDANGYLSSSHELAGEVPNTISHVDSHQRYI